MLRNNDICILQPAPHQVLSPLDLITAVFS